MQNPTPPQFTVGTVVALTPDKRVALVLYTVHSPDHFIEYDAGRAAPDIFTATLGPEEARRLAQRLEAHVQELEGKPPKLANRPN